MAMPFIHGQITRFFETGSTRDVVKVALEIVEVVDEIVRKDMLNEYFHLPEDVYETVDPFNETFDDLKRKDSLQNQDILEEESTGEEEVMDEEFRTWHRETSDKGESFLQFDLDQGSQSDLMGEGVREGDDGDQALAMVQGSAQDTDREQYHNVKAQEMEDRKSVV